jgi:enoyl-CoA hydratase
MSQDLIIQRNGPLLEITLNRPDAGNGATDEMAAELTKLLPEAADSSSLVVLRGAGSDFCIGRASMGRPQPAGPLEALERRRSMEVIFNCYGAFRRAQVPIVGVIQGRALGFGCALAAL